MDSIKDSLGGLMTGSGRKDSIVEAMAKSAARTMGSTVGREIIRGVLGSLMGGKQALNSARHLTDAARNPAARHHRPDRGSHSRFRLPLCRLGGRNCRGMFFKPLIFM